MTKFQERNFSEERGFEWRGYQFLALYNIVWNRILIRN